MNAPSISPLAHDRQFAAALAAGPVAWIVLALALNLQPGPSWILGDPLRALSLVVAWPLLEEALFAAASSPPCCAHARVHAKPGA